MRRCIAPTMTAAATACRRHHQQQRAAARAVTALAAPLRVAADSAAPARCGAVPQLRCAPPHAAATRSRRRRAADRASPFWSAAAAGAQASPTFEDVLLECNNINTLAHILWARVVVPGDTCVDATAGNGFDALALARLALAPPADGAPVGGRVLALDVQALAVDATRVRLAAALTPEQMARCELVHGCHSQLGALLPAGSAKLVAFNLGFLPQKNQAQKSKECVTRPDTTALALRAAADTLLPGGCLSVMVYSGHPEGPEEAAVVDAFAAALPPRQWTSTSISLMNRAAAPRLVLMYRRHCGVVAPAAAA